MDQRRKHRKSAVAVISAVSVRDLGTRSMRPGSVPSIPKRHNVAPPRPGLGVKVVCGSRPGTLEGEERKKLVGAPSEMA